MRQKHVSNSLQSPAAPRLRILPAALSLVHFGAWAAPAAVTEAWVQRYSMGNPRGEAKAVAVDGGGNVLVTGSSYLSVSASEAYTVKYTAADGALLWEQRYLGIGTGFTGGLVVAFDNDGNLLMLGTAYNGRSNTTTLFDYYLAKYAAGDGALMWEQRPMAGTYSGDTGHGRELGLEVDAQNNVVMIGGAATAKYAAATGALVWEKPFPNPAKGLSSPTALAVDVGGNAIVTGRSRNRPGFPGDDFYTVKYAAADGAVLWEAFLNSPVDGPDEPTAAAVDVSGNVVVTGSTITEGVRVGFTGKYAASDGALIWKKFDRRYDKNGVLAYFSPVAVTVDAAGNAFLTGSRFASEPRENVCPVYSIAPPKS